MTDVPHKVLSQQQFTSLFPLLSQRFNGKPLVYFDNAATVQKPLSVINQMNEFYRQKNANVHRSSHAVSTLATNAFEQARVKVQQFINAKSSKEIIWTKGTTEAINLVADSWGKTFLKQGDEIILSVAEHHANIVPWQLISQRTGAVIKVAPIDEYGRINLASFEALLTNRTKMVAINHISNVIGKTNPIEQIIKLAKEVNAKVLIDAAQSIAHLPINVQLLDCDFLVFSGHKMFGPTGVGVLYGKEELLSEIPPYQAGGEMIKKVSFEQTTFNELPFKFEAGTPNIANAIGLGEAIDFIVKYQAVIKELEISLTEYAFKKLTDIPEVKLTFLGKPDVAIFSLTIAEHHIHDVASMLDAHGIAVRAGHHCAMPLMEHLQLPGTLRVSLTAYNSKQEIDYLVKHLTEFVQQTPQQEQLEITKPINEDSFETTSEIIARFNKASGWDGRHRELMLHSKQLDRLAIEQRNETTLISGCESSAWLAVINTQQKGQHTHYYFQADSDAKVIRGLLVIILAAVNGQSADYIRAFDLNNYFKQLGLTQHLSPSRSNGVLAIVAKIKALVG